MVFSTYRSINKPVFIATGETDDEIVVKKAGRIHFFAFDLENRCVGIFVKRPDVALMFQRHDLFAPLSACSFNDEGVILDSNYKMITNDLKKDGLDPKLALVLDGMYVFTENGEQIGIVDDINCDVKSGAIENIVVSGGGVADCLLGKCVLDASLIIGVKTGSGSTKLMTTDDKSDTGLGALIVKEESKLIKADGGLVKKVAISSVKAKNKTSQVVGSVKDRTSPRVNFAKEKAGSYAKKGKKVAIKTISDTKKGIVGFKDEFLKEYQNKDKDF